MFFVAQCNRVKVFDSQPNGFLNSILRLVAIFVMKVPVQHNFYVVPALGTKVDAAPGPAPCK
jgi:hypothetical protein